MLSASNSRQFKREQRKRFVLREGYLDAQKRACLHRLIPQDSPTEGMHIVERGIDSGEMKLLDVFEDGRIVGITIYSIEENENGREFLSIASYGESGSDLSRSIIPKLEDYAREFGCKTIRLHTMRTGLVKKLTDHLGWYVSEIVMRKDLNVQ